jgi:hypothetical protein
MVYSKDVVSDKFPLKVLRLANRRKQEEAGQGELSLL